MLEHREAERLMAVALEHASQGLEQGEIPIGAILAYGRPGALMVIAAAHNQNILLGRRTAHAEMRAFEGAQLPASHGAVPRCPDDPVLVLATTLEPCVMCYAAAMLSAVDLILFGIASPSDGGAARVAPVSKPPAKPPKLIEGVLAHRSRALFERWVERNSPGARHWDFVTGLLRTPDSSAS